jgi:predicted RNase H-like HicB family nuclease
MKKIAPPFSVAFDRETDGRWIAEVTDLPGVMAYGSTKNRALRQVSIIALRTLADRAEAGKRLPPAISGLFDHGVASR